MVPYEVNGGRQFECADKLNECTDAIQVLSVRAVHQISRDSQNHIRALTVAIHELCKMLLKERKSDVRFFRAQVAEQQTKTNAARVRLDCAEVLTCHECEKLFNADKNVRKDRHLFCGSKCAASWEKHALCLR